MAISTTTMRQKKISSTSIRTITSVLEQTQQEQVARVASISATFALKKVAENNKSDRFTLRLWVPWSSIYYTTLAGPVFNYF
jgi:hypothetical protein